METKNYTDAQVTAQVAQLRQKLIPGRILIAIGVLLTVFGLLSMLGANPLGMFMIFLGMALLAVGIALNNKVHNDIKKLLSDHLMPPVLEEIFDSARHEPFERLPDYIVRGIDMGIPTFNEISGSDYIEGVYQGLNVQMSDLKLVHRERRRVRVNGKWKTQETRTTVFEGQWLVCDFGKELAADLLLCEKGLISLIKSSVETENIAFNKKFSIFSSDGHSVFYILTPHMMEYILSMDEKGGGTTRMRFTRDGKVHIAIHNHRDGLQIRAANYDALDTIRAQFRSDIRYLTDIIDELRLVDTMYK